MNKDDPKNDSYTDLNNKLGLGPSQARLGSARLVTKEGSSSSLAWLEEF